MKQNIVLFAFGVVFIAIIIYISIAFPNTISQYFGVYKTILAIACAGIAAIVPGFFQLRYKTMIRAGGALGVFTFIMLFVEPNKEFFHVRVVLKNQNSSPIAEKGKIVMELGSEIREESILNSNDVLFQNIPIRYLNSNVSFGISFTQSYQLVFPDSLYRLSENQIINLKIRLKLETHIHGMVIFEDKPLQGVNVNINGIKTTTDSDGNYSIDLPKETLEDNQTVSFYKEGYKLQRIPIHLQTLKELDVIFEK